MNLSRSHVKVAFISTLEGHGWGGSEELWSGCAKILASRDLFVTSVVNPWPTPVKQHADLIKSGVAVDQIRIGWATKRSLARRVIDKIRRRSTPWMDRVRPDFVVFSLSGHHQGADWMSHCLARRIPYAIIVQAVTEAAWPGESGRVALAKVYGNAEHVYFVSAGNRELVRSMLAVPLLNSSVVSNPFGVSYDASPPWPGSEDDTLRLACVGRLHLPSKGQDVFLGALANDHWRGRNVQVTLYGNGPDKLAIEALIAMYQLEDKVKFGGFVSDVESIFAQNHATLLSSRYEGLPIAVIESMICNRACIVTDIAGNAENISDNVTGFVAPGVRIHYVDEALERCWQRRGELREMGLEAGRQIRTLIPADPVLDLADKLTVLIDHRLR